MRFVHAFVHGNEGHGHSKQEYYTLYNSSIVNEDELTAGLFSVSLQVTPFRRPVKMGRVCSLSPVQPGYYELAEVLLRMRGKC